MRAIVLSGGGSKGAYQIGVWKALRKLHLSYDIVTGTSVGALNGAFMVQKDYQAALKLWKQMNFSLVFKEPFECEKIKKEDRITFFRTYLRKAIKAGGMDVSALEHTIDTHISIPKFYQSKINFGLITMNLSKFKPVELTKNEIPKEQLGDYLMASASFFPGFRVKKIDGARFIDGGYYDNLPINLAVEMGADEIIAVDLQEVGRKRRVKNDNLPITCISPRNNLGNFLVFEEKQSRRMIDFGYNDTMKMYRKLEGDLFTFHKRQLSLHHSRYYAKWKKSFLSYKLDEEFYDQKVYQSFLKKDEELELELLELLGTSFSLEESKIYTISSYRSSLRTAWLEEKKHLKLSDDSILEKVKELTDKKQIILHLYLLKKEKIEPEHFKRLMVLFPKEYLAACYLELL